MKKVLLYCILITGVILSFQGKSFCDDNDEWSKALDVYNSGGLDRPVSAIEYQKVLKELEELKNKNTKKKKHFWQKPDEEPLQKTQQTQDEVKVERNDIIKITTPLYYDGQFVPVGFYKIICSEENSDYFINLMQGKTSIIKVKAQKVSHMDFCSDKVNCLESEVYDGKYFKISFKTLDYAVQAYLTIVK